MIYNVFGKSVTVFFSSWKHGEMVMRMVMMWARYR